MLQLNLTINQTQPCLHMSGELTIYTASQAKQDISSLLAEHPSLELDLHGIEEIDTAGIQLLLWSKRMAELRGGVLTLVHHSPAVVELFDLLNVVGTFGDTILLVPSAS